MNKMKMKQMFRNFVAIAAIAAGMTACSSEEIVPDVQPAIERANLTIVLNNNDAATKAVKDDNAVAKETAITSIHLFIFNGAVCEKDTTFTNAGTNPFKPNTNPQGGAEVDNEFKATLYNVSVGAKKIYVGVNLTNTRHTNIATNGVATPIALADLTALGELYPASGGFPMFSDGTVQPEFTIVQNKMNELSVSVKRLVAKVTVETSSDFENNAGGVRTANGATVDAPLTFAMGQVNTKFFPFPMGSTAQPEDPNYYYKTVTPTATYLSDFINDWPTSNFKNVVTSGNAGTIGNFDAAYILENTHTADYKPLRGELTYASVKATFIPANFHSYAAGAITETANLSPTTAITGDLYVFKNVPNNGGAYYYFTDQAQANAYAAAKGATYTTYTDGTCYYTVFLNPTKGNNVYRNDYYKVKVESIVRLGNSTPDLEDPEIELGGTADLEVTITVQEWNKVDQSVELGKDN
jgi:hypothetical protein